MDGTLAVALFDNPTGVVLASDGTLYVTEYDGERVRTIANGQVTTLVSPQPHFVGPFAIAITAGGALVVQTDYDKNGVKSTTSGTLWTVTVPTGMRTVLADGFGRPRGLAALTDGRLLVSDRLTSTLSTVSPTGTITPLAGSANATGYVDAVGSAARFNAPYGAAALTDGTVIVADSLNHVLRRVALDGTTTTFAGDGQSGTVDATTPLAARFVEPRDVAGDAAGDVFVTDVGAHRVRVVTAAGAVRTVAGDGTAGFGDGAGAQARFYGQESLEASSDGKIVYVADGDQGDGTPYHRVRRIDLP
jgi:hypothetical protein